MDVQLVGSVRAAYQSFDCPSGVRLLDGHQTEKVRKE